MSKNKILTTHVGSLPRTKALLQANEQRAKGTITEEDFNKILEESIDEVVKRQKDIGIDIINEGEYGHITSGTVDFGAWWNYSFYRLGGLEMTDEDRWAKTEKVRSEPGNIKLTSFSDRRDREKFREAYEDPDSGVLGKRTPVGNPVFIGPVTYIGQEQVERDVRLLKKAMEKNGIEQGFMAAVSPGSAARLEDRYYHNEIGRASCRERV